MPELNIYVYPQHKAGDFDADEAAKGVKRPLLQQYERIRRGRAPLALYPLHGEACGHCYTAVPLHRRQDILNSQSVTACEACGVIVYHAAH